MPVSQHDHQAVRAELERVLSSACFTRTKRVSKLLRFVAERQLQGRENELKESVIGVEVFGRDPDYNPKLDSTVRTEAVHLRSRLKTYYSSEGRHNPLAIDLPKGSYVPRFRAQTTACGEVEWSADCATARRLFTETMALWEQAGDRLSLARTMSNLAGVVCEQGDYEAARKLHELCLSILPPC